MSAYFVAKLRCKVFKQDLLDNTDLQRLWIEEGSCTRSVVINRLERNKYLFQEFESMLVLLTKSVWVSLCKCSQ